MQEIYVMFSIEVSLYSLFPPEQAEQGGMSLLLEFKNVWYRSVWFYAVIVIISLLLYFSIQQKRQ